MHGVWQQYERQQEKCEGVVARRPQRGSAGWRDFPTAVSRKSFNFKTQCYNLFYTKAFNINTGN